MAHFLYYNGSQSVVLGPGASASAPAGIQWETQITALPKTCPVRNSVDGAQQYVFLTNPPGNSYTL